MINYPATLPYPLISGNTTQGGRTFLRSEFDYSTRQRATFCGDYKATFNFTLSSSLLMKEFKDFYYSVLFNGQKSFLADWEVEGISGSKEFRFSKNYSVVSLGNGIHRVSAEFEMITKIKDL